MTSMFSKTKALAVDEVSTPIGRVRICVSPRGVVGIDLPGAKRVDPKALVPKDLRELPITGGDDRTRLVTRQLAEYFEGKRRRFDLPLAPHGAAFDQRVWARVAKIPY